jgi:predicted alpha/beta hydrolase family esterase
MTVLILAGVQGAEMPGWLGRWSRAQAGQLVEQDDFVQPLRGDWLARLDHVVVDTPGTARSIVLVAHHLGCGLVAAWAAVSRHTARIRGALLVDPLDLDRSDLSMALQRWAPMPCQRLPFSTLWAASPGNLHCSEGRAGILAQAWGACQSAKTEAVDNPEPCCCGWPEGHAMLHQMKA